MAMIAAGFSGGEAEELRRAFGFKRSEKRMRDIEVKLREGMERNGISREAQEQIILSITSFALYGFPESHAASFALIAYASAYLKCHYLAAFTAALLNNQPMGFYQPGDHRERCAAAWTAGEAGGHYVLRLAVHAGAGRQMPSRCAWAFVMRKGCAKRQRRRFCANAASGRLTRLPIWRIAFRSCGAMSLVLLASIGALNSMGNAIVATRTAGPSIDADLAHRVANCARNDGPAGARSGTDKQCNAKIYTAQPEGSPLPSSVCIGAMRCGRWSAPHALPGRCWKAFRRSTALRRWRP